MSMNEYRLKDLETGMSESFTVTVTEEMLESFREITGDVNELHCDEGFAKARGHRTRVAYGMLTASFLSTLAGVYLPGRYSLIEEVSVKFAHPVYPGDRLTVTGTVSEVDERFSRFTMKTEIRDRNGTKVLRGTMKVGFTDEG